MSIRLNWFRRNWQWWSYEVRRGGVHERTYLAKRDATKFAKVSQKIRGGRWIVYRTTKRRNKIVEIYHG